MTCHRDKCETWCAITTIDSVTFKNNHRIEVVKKSKRCIVKINSFVNAALQWNYWSLKYDFLRNHQEDDSKRSKKSNSLINFLKINNVCATRKNERACRYLRERIYLTRIESLNHWAFTRRVLRIEKISMKKRYRLNESRTHA